MVPHHGELRRRVEDVRVSSDQTVGASAFNGASVTYTGVTLVKDTDTTADYQFGYADIHVNGGNYGTAINPYTAAAPRRVGMASTLRGR